MRGYRLGNVVGESPAWHSEKQCLYWIDVRRQQLLQLDPSASVLARWDLPEVVGAIALCHGHRVCLALKHDLAVLDVDTGMLKTVASVELDRPANRLNDGKVSNTGRWFVFGSMDDRPQKQATGGLYCADAKGQVRQLHDGLTIANGIAWSPEGTHLYFSDSLPGVLYKAAWDEDTGSMGEPIRLALLDEVMGRPDGAAIDLAGNYWSAGVSAGCLNVVDSTGTLLRKVALPCRAPTMPAFAGVGHSTVYVTSLIRPQWDQPGPWDGALLELHCDVAGFVPPLFALT